VTDPSPPMPAEIHIANANVAQASLCGLTLWDGDRLLAPFMRLDSYRRLWWGKETAPNYPRFCKACIGRLVG
jgi:hypothetical protein